MHRKAKRTWDIKQGLKKDMKNQKKLLRTKVVEVEELRNGLEKLSGCHEALVQHTKDVERERNRLRMRDVRAPEKERKAVEHAREEERTYNLKENGVITDDARELTRQLVTDCQTPARHVQKTIETAAQHFGVQLQGSIHKRSVSRIILEGGLASNMQLAEELSQVPGYTISGDGTSHCHIQYESKHVVYTLPGASEPVTRTLPILSAPDHTAETQIAGLKAILEDLSTTYRNSPTGSTSPTKHLVTPVHLMAKIDGMGSDHAEDQKKVARGVNNMKLAAAIEVKGQDLLASMPGLEAVGLLWEKTQEEIQEVGGMDVWEVLPDTEKENHVNGIYSHVCQKLGADAFGNMKDEEKQGLRRFVWGGCCMHKDMNAAKGGNTHLMAYWEAVGAVPPIKLMNRDNRAAAEAGSSSAKDHAEEVSQGGAVKATSLAGAAFNHKDDKKGWQDSFKVFFEKKYGYRIHFPDTSNTRFQSHGRASEELMIHLHYYIEFLEHIRDGKLKNAGWNNMEENVYKALNDVPTLTELTVLSLYSQAISYPYMRHVRKPGLTKVNLLDLGPLHEQVKEHCSKIIKNPDLLLAADASYKQGSLDGKPWSRPEVFYAVQKMGKMFPHLRGALVAFFEGALETWERFCAEFKADGPMAKLSPTHRSMIWISATNDANEGHLGSMRLDFWRMPSITLHQLNARTMYKVNDTGKYMENLPPEDQQYLRKEARKIDGDGLERKRRIMIADGEEERVVGKRRKIAAQAKVAEQANTKLDELFVRLDVNDLVASPGKNDDLDLQIDWHRRHEKLRKGEAEEKIKIPAKSTVSNKAKKVAALTIAINHYNSLPLEHCHGPQKPGGLGKLSDLPVDGKIIEESTGTGDVCRGFETDGEDSDWE